MRQIKQNPISEKEHKQALKKMKERLEKFRIIHKQKYGQKMIQQEKQQLQKEKKRQIQREKNRLSAQKHRKSLREYISELKETILQLRRRNDVLSNNQLLCSNCQNDLNHQLIVDYEVVPTDTLTQSLQWIDIGLVRDLQQETDPSSDY